MGGPWRKPQIFAIWPATSFSNEIAQRIKCLIYKSKPILPSSRKYQIFTSPKNVQPSSQSWKLFTYWIFTKKWHITWTKIWTNTFFTGWSWCTRLPHKQRPTGMYKFVCELHFMRGLWQASCHKHYFTCELNSPAYFFKLWAVCILVVAIGSRQPRLQPWWFA